MMMTTYKTCWTDCRDADSDAGLTLALVVLEVMHRTVVLTRFKHLLSVEITGE